LPSMLAEQSPNALLPVLPAPVSAGTQCGDAEEERPMISPVGGGEGEGEGGGGGEGEGEGECEGEGDPVTGVDGSFPPSHATRVRPSAERTRRRKRSFGDMAGIID
jgi:hypothetical protein